MEALLTAGALLDPSGVGRKAVFDGYGIKGRQLVGVQVANRSLDGSILCCSGLEQNAPLWCVLHSAVPSVKALNRGDLSARSQFALDEHLGDAAGVFQCCHRCVDCDQFHGSGSKVPFGPASI